jgi:acyl transferase domain-containing protein
VSSHSTVDTSAFFAGVAVVELPTYAFQRRSYWLRPTSTGDLGAVGLTATGHPLLGALLGVAESDRLVLTGRLSLQSQPWLVDHAVLDTVLLPGTAFVELAGRAAEHTGATAIEELTLRAPLTLTADRAVDLQVWTGPDDNGRRAASGPATRPAPSRSCQRFRPHRTPSGRRPARNRPRSATSTTGCWHAGSATVPRSRVCRTSGAAVTSCSPT